MPEGVEIVSKFELSEGFQLVQENARRDFWRGREIKKFDEHEDAYVYISDGTPVHADPCRACGHCGLANTSEGHDGCLGTLPGVSNACCGHGVVGDAYVQYEDGRVLRGYDAWVAQGMPWVDKGGAAR